MFHTDARGSTWSHTIHGRGKRLDEVKTGCYLVEHIATGKLITGTSDQVSRDVDRIIQAVHAGTYPCPALLKLCAHDPDLKLYEYPTGSLKEAKAIERQVRATLDPAYLLLTPKL